MKLLSVLLFCFGLNNLSIAQSIKYKHSIGLELMGSGDIGGIAYERFFTQHQSLATSISWIPGTWRLHQENDRSFLYLPIAYQLYKKTPFGMFGLSLGTLQSVILYNQQSDDWFIRPQIGLLASFPYQKKIKICLSLYAKLPYQIHVNRYHFQPHKLPSTLFWPGASLQYAF
jgi:hypothetical protein